MLPFECLYTERREMEMTFDLLSTKDTSLVGEIGEVIARRYLWQKRIVVYNPGRIMWLSLIAEQTHIENLYAEIQKNHGKFEELNLTDQRLLVEYSQVKDLGEERIRYLIYSWDYGTTSNWDYAGYDLHSKEVYLIEVKTSRVRKKYGLTGGYKRGDLEKVKSLGFKLLLINIRLLDNWQFEVSDREL